MAEAVIELSSPLGRAEKTWWNPPESVPLHRALFNTMQFLKDAERARRAKLLRLTRLFANSEVLGLGPGEYFRSGDSEQDLRINVVRNMVDAVQARIAKNKPRCTVLTEGGDFALQKKAKRLEDFLWGLFHRTGVYELAPLQFRDAAMWGTSALKIFADGNEVCVERTYPWELHVDPVEAYHGRPRSLFQTRLVDRQVLKALYPTHAGTIDDAKAATHDDGLGADRLADQILVVEAWHLPSGRKAKDGKHVIAIEEATLKEADWTEPRFPFVFLRWSDPAIGFWGDALSEEIEGIQNELTELLQKAQAAMYHVGTPWIIVDKQSSVESEIDNDTRGCIVRVGQSEKEPKVVTHSTVAPEVFAQQDRLYARAFEVGGVSQLAAQAKKPAGLESGAALREFNDIETERFIIRGQAFERWFVEVGQLMLATARRIDASGKTVELRARRMRRRRHWLELIKWNEVDLDAEAFDLKVFPASSLPNSPAGRIAAVESMVQAGLIPPEDALPLLDFPDVDSVVSRRLAPYEIVVDMIERMIDDGEYVSPEPFMDLALGIRLMQSAYLRAKMDRVPEEHLQLLRNWMTTADKMMQPATPAAPAAAAPNPNGGQPMPVPDPMAAAGAAIPPQMEAA